MQKERNDYFDNDISLEKEKYMNHAKHEIERFMKDNNCTMKELAESANIPFATLNNLLYSKTYKDCKLSTAVNLAKAMNISLDELLGCITISSEDYELLSTLRTLPKRTRYMVNWFLDYQLTLAKSFNHDRQCIINVMHPEFRDGMNLLPSNDFSPLDITAFPNEVKTKVFMGIYLSCDHYMPTYCPYDILLIANDRPAKPSEICVIQKLGHLYLAKRIETDSGIQYLSIRDQLFRATDQDLDSVIGYVVDVFHDLS